MNESSIYSEYGIDIDVDEELANLLSDMDEMKGSMDDNTMDSLFTQCKDVVVDSIIGPFGLTRNMFHDKDGGNVTTIHNAKNQIFANEKDRNNYNRSYRYIKEGNHEVAYDPTKHDYKKTYDKYHDRNENYKQQKEVFKTKSEMGTVIDDYTGSNISGNNYIVNKKGNTIKQPRYETEHYVAAKEVHDNERVKLFMTENQSTDLANSKKNLGATSKSINASKSDTPYKEWSEKSSSHDNTIKNKDAYGINEEAEKKVKNSRKNIKKEVAKSQIKKQGSELLVTGGKQAVGMGARQALGYVFREVAEAVFFELRDLIRNGRSDDLSFIQDFKIRLSRMIEKIKNKWKDALMAFGEGAISGFLSNLITFFINTFASTFKRLTKVIREGFTSIVKAIKIIANPGEYSRGEAVYEAVKILSAAAVVSLGLLFEEALSKFLLSIPFLGAFAEIISPVLMGIITGVATVLVLYGFDKLKEKINLNHKKITLIHSGVLANQYKVLQTLIVLDKSVAFNNQLTLQIEENLKEGDESLKRHERTLSEASKTISDKLNRFKMLTE